jgi:hypothetical protein
VLGYRLALLTVAIAQAALLAQWHWQGGAWIYRAVGDDVFARHALKPDAPMADDAYVVADLTAETEIVVTGPQAVLSEEVRAQGQSGTADDDELAILSENREYLRELRYAQNTPCYYLDTSINIHQVAQNLLLMEDRFAVKDAKNYRFEVGGTTLFVENIPTEFAEEDMWSHFSKLQSGLICAKVCRNPRTKESMGFGYVCFDEGIAISNPVWASFKISAVTA